MLKDTLRAKEEDKQQLKLIKKKDKKELKVQNNTKQRRQITVKIKQDTEGWHGWNFKRN